MRFYLEELQMFFLQPRLLVLPTSTCDNDCGTLCQGSEGNNMGNFTDIR